MLVCKKTNISHSLLLTRQRACAEHLEFGTSGSADEYNGKYCIMKFHSMSIHGHD